MIWLVLFILIPLADMTLLVYLAGVIGFWQTVALTIATGVVGHQLARSQGIAVLRGIQADLAEGRAPTDRLVHGALVLAGGILLITPGVITDLAGLLLMIPGNRRFLGRLIVDYARKRIALGAGNVFMFHTTGPRNPFDMP